MYESLGVGALHDLHQRADPRGDAGRLGLSPLSEQQRRDPYDKRSTLVTVAFIYMTGGWTIRVSKTRDDIIAELNASTPGLLLEFEADAPTGRSSGVAVAVAPTQIVLVTDELVL
jgi:hypothetical protein